MSNYNKIVNEAIIKYGNTINYSDLEMSVEVFVELRLRGYTYYLESKVFKKVSDTPR